MEYSMDYNEAISYISSGEAVLFTGSYFSVGSLNYEKEPIPDSDDLKNILLKRIGEPTDSKEDLKTVAQFALHDLGPKEYGNILRSQFNVKEPSRDVDIISSKTWSAIFTTNYDNAIEKSSGRVTSSPNSDVRKSSSLADEVYHINGSIDDLTSKKDDVNRLLLSNDSYLENDFLTSPGYNTFVNALIYAKAIFFVGYSVFSDLDIARIISRDDIAAKSFFVTGDSGSRMEKQRISQYGTYTGKSTHDFAEEIQNIKTQKSVSSSIDNSLRSFHKVEPPKDYAEQPKIDNDINNLINKGHVVDEHILNPNYIVNRWSPYASEVLSIHGDKIVTVRSKIGNGKTIFMKGLAQYISAKRNVFELKGPSDYFYGDLKKINENYDDPIIFLDDIGEFRNNFRVIIEFHKKGITFVISARNPLMEQAINALTRESAVDNSNIVDLANLDKLKRNDFNKWTQNIETYHLWGRGNKQLTRKLFEHNKAFSKLLIDIFKSSGIMAKYQSLFQKSNDAPTSEARLIISILILNLLNSGKSMRLEALLNILSVTVTEEMKMNELLTEFIDFSNMEIINTSSILSQEILHDANIFTPEKIYQTILFLMQGIDKKTTSKQNNSIQRALTSFSNLTLIFGGGRRDRRNKQIHGYISNYYSEVQKLDFAKDNVFFFVQLTNSKIYAGDYDLATKYLDFAEGEADRLKLRNDYQLVTTKINLYIEFSSRLLKKNPEDYLEKIEWSADQVTKYQEVDYILTLFSKLSYDENGFLHTVNRFAREHKSAFYDVINRLYDRIQFSDDFDEIEMNHKKELNSLKKVISRLK
ncbi:SIR2 family protein [Lactobacillaceae bacterium L1_55_11]|nr:SIR2 family protein [Lactobacillaceae bacterium L1_55_11]